jgi:hypothetical protein
MEELSYTANIFRWYCYTSLLIEEPLLPRLMVVSQSGASDKVHSQGQLLTEGEDWELIF